LTLLIPVCLVIVATTLCVLVLWLAQPHGRHEADSLAQADWTPRTHPLPAPGVRLRKPRYAPDVRPAGQLIREAYASAELRISRELTALADWPVLSYE
jgi:hypothetical protein